MSRVGVVAGRRPRRLSARASRRALVAISALLVTGSGALTVVWGASMSEMGAMPMHGGSTMSAAWTGMSGLPWPGALASFVVMWTVMMAAMMLPSLAPTLWQYHRAVEGMGVPRPGWQTVLVGLGYFVVWAAVGRAVFSLGAALGAAEMRLRRSRAPFRSRLVWSSWSPARSSSPRGRRITLPGIARHRRRAVRRPWTP